MFIAYDGRGAIWGMGESKAEALADAVDNSQHLRPLTLNVLPCTTKLARDLDEIGGAVLWVEIDGVAYSMVPDWDDALPVQMQVC